MKKLLIIFLGVLTLASCSKLTELNTDPKNPEEVPSGTLFANAEMALFNQMCDINVNYNNFRLWAQHWTETTYTDESNYELIERNVNGRHFDAMYATVLRDLEEARTILLEDQFLTDENKKNQGAIIDVLQVYTYHNMVDIFGDVPYSEALGDDVTPAYDDDDAIYNGIIATLNAAIGNLSGESGLDEYDLIYGGDVASWRKMANSLKLRLAIRIADINSAQAGTMAAAAVNDGVFTSSSDNFALHYSSSTPYTNPVWDDLVASGRDDYVAANTLVDYMNALEDPRRSLFFTGPMDSVGNPVGGVFGKSSPYGDYSHVNTSMLTDPTLEGILLDYTEVEFLLADAVERGYSVGGTAEGHYNNGVTESIMYWGGSAGDATTYLANPDVAYTTAPGTWREKIAMQKWIALYNRGFEAWSTWRLYDAPTLNLAYGVQALPPTRYIYPRSEYSLNGESVEAAGQKFNNDDSYAKVFWDVN